MSNQQVKFGFNQIANRTPAAARWTFRIILYLAAAVNIVIGIVTEIPEDTRFLIAKYSVYAVTLVHAFSKLFGIENYEPNHNPPFRTH